jgi:hypothetical protein
MRTLFGQIDALLRGNLTRREELRKGRLPVSSRTLILGAIVLGGAYGAFMGLYAALRPVSPTLLQLPVAMVKVPLLFLLTLAVTMPSLYVFSTLAGSRLRWQETGRLLLCGIAVNLALLASFGPVTGFFTLSTDSYHFMVLLNVIFFAAGGIAGLAFVARALEAVFEEAPPEEQAPAGGPGPEGGVPPASPPPAPEEAGRPPVLRAVPRRKPGPRTGARLVFRVWVFIYAAVGAQMGWLLRPFIGWPDAPFSLFREKESNFFEAFFRGLRALLFPGG